MEAVLKKQKEFNEKQNDHKDKSKLPEDNSRQLS